MSTDQDVIIVEDSDGDALDATSSIKNAFVMFLGSLVVLLVLICLVAGMV